MKILCVFGRHNYGNPDRGTSYEFANFIPALRNLGHEVIQFESWSHSEYGCFADLNQAFLEAIEKVQPDVVFCVLIHYELWLEVLDAVHQRCPAVMVHWGTDDSWKYSQFSRWLATVFHLHVTTVPEALTWARRDGLSNFVLSQWAANSATLAEPLPAQACKYGVTFVGSAYGNRSRWIAGLRERGIDVKCFGYGWDGGAVPAEEIPRIMRESVLSLNFGDSALHLGKYGLHRRRQIKARVFEVSGAGGCLISESAPHLSDYYVPGKEIVTFEGLDDLAERITWLLAHPQERDAIARAGHQRTIRDHTYERRFTELLEIASQRTVVRETSTQKDCRFDRDWLAGLREQHRTGSLLRALRGTLIGVMAIFLGSRRGARAARRLVYEISWRVLGRRTYTSAGLPGRMFYPES